MRADLRKIERLLEDAAGRVRLALLLDDAKDDQQRRLRDSIIDAHSDAKEASGYLYLIIERFDEG